MRLEAKLKADLSGFKLHRAEDSNVLTATLGITFKLDEATAKTHLGERFAALAFAGLSWDGEIPIHAHSGVKPNEVWEKHQLKIAGHGPFPVLPERGGVKPVKDEAAVLVDLRLPIFAENKVALGELAAKFGEIVDVDLAAAQGELPLGEAGMVVKKNTGNWGNAQPVVA